MNSNIRAEVASELFSQVLPLDAWMLFASSLVNKELANREGSTEASLGDDHSTWSGKLDEDTSTLSRDRKYDTSTMRHEVVHVRDAKEGF